MGPPPYGGPPMGPPGYFPGAAGPRRAKVPGMALAGFILSIVSIFLGILFIPEILGLIFSIVGLSQAKKTKAPRGLAIAGIIISAVVLAGWLLMVIIGLATGDSSSTTTYDYNTYPMILPFLSFLF